MFENGLKILALLLGISFRVVLSDVFCSFEFMSMYEFVFSDDEHSVFYGRLVVDDTLLFSFLRFKSGMICLMVSLLSRALLLEHIVIAMLSVNENSSYCCGLMPYMYAELRVPPEELFVYLSM